MFHNGYKNNIKHIKVYIVVSQCRATLAFVILGRSEWSLSCLTVRDLTTSICFYVVDILYTFLQQKNLKFRKR